MPIASPEVYAEMLDRAKAGAFAYPAINVSSSQTLNAALRGFAEAGTPIDAPANARGPGDPRWNADAADVARIALQRPFRVLIHAHELVGA